VKYLSPEWLVSANEAVADLKPSADTATVGYVATDGPDGDVSYTLVLGPDVVAVVSGADGAGVRLTLDWYLAAEIAQSRASAQRAFLSGSIRVSGDVQVLIGNNEIMVAIDNRLAKLRSQTVY
jgi:hypothetical protein